MHNKTVGIIGAGDIGLNLAEILALKGYNILLHNRYHAVDDKPSPYWLSKMGKVMDMNDSLQLPGCGVVKLTSDLNELKTSTFLVITAGAKRTNPEETREELAGKNAKIIHTYIDFLIDNPSFLTLIISNPVDSLTQYLIEKIAEKTAKPVTEISKKIVGVSYIDSMRLKNLVKEFLVEHHPTLQNASIEAIAIGEHGPSMVPLISSVFIDGRPLSDFASQEQIDYIAEHTILRGNDIIKLTGASSIMGPAHAVMYMIEEINSKAEAIIPCSVWDGKRAIGRMAKFTKNTFDHIVDIDLNNYEKDMLEKSEKSLDKQYETILNLLSLTNTVNDAPL
ncbi:MAG: lactate/malate family dehydrogenase [Alphaproteobacteria bacterium]